MTKQEQGVPVTPGESAPSSRSPWMWVAIGFAVIAVILLIWGLSTKSDLNGTKSDLDAANQQIAQLKTESEKNKGVAGTITAAAKAAYDALAQQLGVTTQDLAASQQQLQSAQQNATQAAQSATEAQQAAQQATSATDKAKATANQLKAQANAATAKAAVAADCAKASLSAVGQLFEGDSIQSQVPAVKQDLQTIGAQCKSTIGGS